MKEPYRVVVADPAWSFDDKLPGKSRGATKNYRCMSWSEVALMQRPSIADDALLFLWRVAAMQKEALAVMHMWHFDLNSEIVWMKTKKGARAEAAVNEGDLAFGMGRYVRMSHEVCLIGSRGRGLSMIRNHSVRSVFFAPRRAHSEKPCEFFDIVDRLTGGAGPRIELFARANRAGWDCTGAALGHEYGRAPE